MRSIIKLFTVGSLHISSMTQLSTVFDGVLLLRELMCFALV